MLWFYLHIGGSKSLIEAAVMQLPIITTDVPGWLDVVQNGINGLLCTPRDTKDLYDKHVCVNRQ